MAAIAGVAESDLGEVAPKTAMQLQAEAAREALAEAGLTFADVDAVLSAGGDTFAASMAIAEYLGITPRYTDSKAEEGFQPVCLGPPRPPVAVG